MKERQIIPLEEAYIVRNVYNLTDAIKVINKFEIESGLDEDELTTEPEVSSFIGIIGRIEELGEDRYFWDLPYLCKCCGKTQDMDEIFDGVMVRF